MKLANDYRTRTAAGITMDGIWGDEVLSVSLV